MNHELDQPPALPRRRFIELVGGGAVLAATAPLAGCSTTYPPAVVRAWQPPAATADVRTWMLAHGLLAPNPHNRQPWIADMRRDAEITLVCDAERLLPETDPFGRQILIGCGAFIELAVIAAAERGHRVRVDMFPDGEPSLRELPGDRAVARLSVTPDAALPRDPLFAQIRRRHTNKGAFDNGRTLPATVWQGLQKAATDRGLMVGAVTGDAAMANMRRITRDSFESEILTPRTYLESARLMRIGPTEVEQNRDGIPLMGTMVRLMSAVGAFDRFEVPERGSSNYKQTMDRWSVYETGSGYFWIASRGNSRAAQLDSGRAYVRAHLQATAAGVDMHPLSQALQEFPEVRPQYDALRALLGVGDSATTVQMLARVGYGATAFGPSPRRELGQLVRA
jgi:hypothetical protein